MLRSVLIVFAAILPVLLRAQEPDRHSLSRPNIVIIMADDLGFSDLGCYGSEIPTPYLDRLAAHGLRFTQFYNCGRCCPTRAALLTGLYPHQAGVGDMETDFGRPAYQGFLNDHCITIAEALRPHGYRACLSGKWNVGHTRPHWPVDRGFDHHFGLLRGASDYFDPRMGPRRNASPFALNDRPFTGFDETFYLTDAITDHAVRWMETLPAQDPFFLYVAYTAPHSPLQARPEDIAKFRGKYREGWDELRRQRHARTVKSGLFDDSVSLAPRDDRVPRWNEVADPDFEDLKMAVFAAQVACMDRGIGRIIATLERRGVLDDTLILFLSDNGGDGASEPATKDLLPGPKGSSHIYGRGWAQLSNTPLRGYKREMLEGGIATPLIAHWPSVIREPRISREVGHVIDLMPTCLEAARVDYPRHHQDRSLVPLEGRSLLPAFRAETRQADRTLFWEHEGHRAVREGPWKIVAAQDGSWQLYDLATDRIESRDLSSTQPEKVRKLAAQYDAWAQRCGVVPWRELNQKR
jgi:arylsulfatase A-like enzyme